MSKVERPRGRPTRQRWIAREHSKSRTRVLGRTRETWRRVERVQQKQRRASSSSTGMDRTILPSPRTGRTEHGWHRLWCEYSVSDTAPRSLILPGQCGVLHLSESVELNDDRAGIHASGCSSQHRRWYVSESSSTRPLFSRVGQRSVTLALSCERGCGQRMQRNRDADTPSSTQTSRSA